MDAMIAPGVPVDVVDVDVGNLRLSFVSVGAAGGVSSAIPEGQSVVVGGTWGVPAPPSLVAATAIDSGRGLGLNSDDSLALVSEEGRPHLRGMHRSRCGVCVCPANRVLRLCGLFVCSCLIKM